MINFSCRHKLHFFVMLVYALHRLIIFHAILKLTLESFSVQTYLLSVVLFLFFDFLKELMWLLNLVLKVPSVIPIYVCCSWLSSLVTVA